MSVVAGAARAHQIAREAYEVHHASQRQDELAEAVRVVDAARPQVIVEIGCDAGGTLYAWRQVCPVVFGITLADNSAATGGQCYPLVDHGAVVRVGDSHDPQTVAWLVGELAGRAVDVLVIDGDHSYAGARTDWDLYSPLVRPGGLVLLHDVLNRWDRRVELGRLWAELSAQFPASWVIASRWHRPVGWGVIEKGQQS